MFALVLKVDSVIQNPCIYKSTKALPRLCRSFHLKIIGISCKDDARVKVPSFQKVTYFSTILKYSTETLFICIFVCLKMILAAVIYDKQASKVLLHLDSSFLLRNSMKTNTTSS